MGNNNIVASPPGRDGAAGAAGAGGVAGGAPASGTTPAAAAAGGAAGIGAGGVGGGAGRNGPSSSGSAAPNSLAGLLPSSQLKWRDGNKTEAIPCPAARGMLTYAKTLEKLDFKEFIYRHLDSDVLVSSVLTENAIDEKVLLQGIHLLQQIDIEKKEQNLEQISAFEDLVAVGLRVDLPGAQSIVDKELDVFNRAESSPFLRAFQRRIAVLLNFRECIATEQKAAKEQRRPRIYVTSDLTTAKYPQLQLLDGLKTTGINMLLLFPICFPLLSSQEEKRLFSAPVEELCERLSNLTNLELFSSWSPAQRPMPAPAKLRLSSARASDGNASHAIDGKMTTFWSTKKTASSFWSVQLEQPCNLSSIKIAWRSVTPTSFTFAGVSEDVGAPKILVISMQYTDSKSAAESSEDVLIVKPDQERIKQGSWEQVYALPSSDRLVISIRLGMVRPANSNTTGSIKMHAFQAYSSMPNMKWVDSLSLMTSLQGALYPIVKKFPDMQKNVFPAIISIVRSSGSLKLTLILIREMLGGDLPLPLPSTVSDFLDLVLLEHKKVAQRLSSTIDTPQPDAIFDKDSKSSLVKITEDGFRITYEPAPGFAATSTSYCMLNCIMSAGVWIWEFSSVAPSTPELDGCYFGVAKRPITNEDYQISSDYYVVRCSNGDLYHDGKITVPSDGPFLPCILSSDICKFTYDSGLQTLSLMINDNDFGIIFRDVQPGVSPVVLFTLIPEAKSRSVRLKQALLREKRSANDKEFVTLQETMAALSDEPESMGAKHSIPLHLLNSVSFLSQIRMEEMVREEALKEKVSRNATSLGSLLEYPFSVEVSADVVSSLLSLLQSLLPGGSAANVPDDARKTAIISLLRILDTQFFCLTKAGVDPETVGFAEIQGKDAEESVVKNAAKVILALTDSCDRDIQMEASKVYARGAVLFLRTVEGKIDLVLTLIRDARPIDPDTSKFLILAMIIKHLSKIDDILEIFSSLKSKEPSFVLRLIDFIAELLRIVAEINISQINVIDAVLDEKNKAMAEFQRVICVLFSRFQEHLIFEITTKASSAVVRSQDDWAQAFMNVLVAYSRHLMLNSERVLAASNEASLEPRIGWSMSQRRLRDSIVPLLLQPLLHSFVICKDNLNLIARLLPHTVQLLEMTSALCRNSKPCKDASKLIFGSIQRRMPRMINTTEELGTKGGWKTVKAVFDSGESTYSVTEEGMIYTSQSQSNTCGIVNIGFSGNQKAAWEFQLLSDTMGDECSLFGAARLPLTSRCYNNSPDLWMRRAYNGHMYCQGRTTTMSPALERIHPGDIVRIEFDGKVKTISYSVNGKDLELGFSDINDTIYPSCGSYRPGVSIRLIKVEIFKDVDNSDDEEPSRSPTVINWNVTSPDNENRAQDCTLRIHVPKTSPAPGAEKWLTAQADKGVESGIHSWSFEFSERSRSLFAVGIVVGVSLEYGVQLATRANIPDSAMEMAWSSDGTLWFNGEQVTASFGANFLPLDRLSVVTMQVDCMERTLSFYVDGEFVGVAFGPADSIAVAKFALPVKVGESLVIFPAASISSPSQTIRISTSGFNGSTVLPFQLSLQKTAASVIGRLSAALLMGLPVDKKESGMLPLLQSSLLIGGLETSNGIGKIDKMSALSWRAMWAQQKSSVDEDFQDFTVENVSPLPAVSEDESEICDFLSLISESAATAEGGPLLAWLEQINPEPVGQRVIMERLNSYSFPKCEYPLISCLLKHAGLAPEAAIAYKAMKEVAGNAASAIPSPSGEMILLWKTVQQLRRYLRGERQKFKTLAATSSSQSESSGASSSDTSPVLEFPPIFSDGKMEEAPLADVSSAVAVAGGAEAGVGDVKVDLVDLPTPPPAPVVSQEKLELFYGYSRNIAWCRQSPIATADGSFDAIAVRAVGIDYEAGFLFVRVHLRGDYSEAMAEATCSLTLDGALDPGVSSGDSEFLVLEKSDGNLVGCFRIDIAAQDIYERIILPTCEVRFTGAIASTSINSVLLLMPTPAVIGVSLEELEEKDTAEVTSAQTLPLFTDLCARIESRVRFLLGIAIASTNTLDSISDGKMKQQRMDIFLQKPSSDHAVVLQQLRSHDGQERWKRVIDLLRVHSQIRKQLSQEDPEAGMNESFGERSPMRSNTSRLQDRLDRLTDTDYDIDLEDSSLSDSSMQACYLFVTTDGAHSSTTCLEEIMIKRLNRASQRIFAMQALQSVLSIPDAFSDPFCMEELLLFFKASFMTPSIRQSSGKQPLSDRIHYLVNLEGCPAKLLMQVQHSFAQLFSGIANLVAQYADSWDNLSQKSCSSSAEVSRETSDSHRVHQLDIDSQNSHLALGPLRILLSIWTLSYSNRDHKFIMDCGLVPSLHKILHLATYERIVETWYATSSKLAEYYSLHCERFKDTKKWIAWPSNFINNKLKSGSLSCREVILHLLLMPFKEISENDRDRLGLENNFETMCATLGAADVSLLNQKVLSLIRFREETEEREKHKKEAAVAAAKAIKDADISARLSICGIFDSAFKELPITLSEYSRVAVLQVEDPTNGEASNVYTTICYDCDIGTAESGNYFEIEILVLSGGDFSIGLADRESVAIDSHLGTTAGSYCYRGDNGHKLGASATSTVFPPFQQGDIIGCGLDMISRAIFYTRNGELLGAAFEGVIETKLWPVVGSFSSSENDVPAKVKVNFGIETFRFTGNDGVFMSAIPTIAINQKALNERSLQIAEIHAADALAAEAALAASLRSERRSRASTMELNIDGGAAEGLIAVTEEEYRRNLDVLLTNLRSATAYLFEFHSLRAYCSAILRFILIKVCDSESLPMGREVQLRSQEMTVPRNRVLMKERSGFGTPKFLTMEDGLLLREGLVAAMVHQLLLGATYLSTAEKSAGFNGNPVKYSLAMNQTPPRGQSKSIRDIQAAHLGGTSAASSSHTAVLEVLEVEKILFEHILSLSTLLILNKSLKNEISKGISLATLFLLLQHGSARIKTVASTILRKLLPDISPAEAENALSSDCKATLAKSEDAISPISGGVRRQKRRIPDGVVRLLLMKAMESLAVIDETGPHAFGYGDMSLTRADQNISLIQHLFEAPMWTELVACNITDALRNAKALVESLGEDALPSFNLEQRNVILGACAACTVLSGLGTLRPGSAVIGSDGTKGTLIKLRESEQQAFVLFKSPGEVAHISDVEMVDISAIKSVRSCVHVDLSRLSQPLLPQLTNLMKCLLGKTSFFKSKETTGSDALLMRLNFVVSNAVSALLDRQPDLVIDATHDSKVIGDIIRMSLVPCGLEMFSSANNITRMWNNMQARVLEGSVAANNVKLNDLGDGSATVDGAGTVSSPSLEVSPISNVADSTGPALSVVPAAGEGSSSDEGLSPVGPSDSGSLANGNVIRYRPDDRIGRRQAAASLIEGDSELSARCPLLVQQRIEYFMGDEVRARASLLSDSALLASDDELDEGWLLGQHASALPNPVEFSSENLLMNAENQLNGTSSDVPYSSNSHIYEMDLVSVTFCPASDDASSSVTTIPTNLPTGSYVIECESEGPLLIESKRKRLGMTADEVAGGKDVIVSYFDGNIGLSMFELVDVGSLKVVRSFFDKTSITHQEMFKLDQACMILRLRRIAAKLLIEGNLNLNQGSLTLDDWLRFIKLTAVTTMMNLDVKEGIQNKRGKVLSSLCSALIARSRVSLSPESSLEVSLAHRASSETAVIAVLHRDISSTFTRLTSSSICLYSSKRAKEISNGDIQLDDVLHCSSPHPFVAPWSTTGKFDIPPDWKGVMLSFHPKCSTPSKLASLDFFKTSKSFEENKPDYSYSSSFLPLILTDAECLYYRFNAPEASDRPLLGVVQLQGPVKIDFSQRVAEPHNSISVRAQREQSAPVGLGEDDTLFNLFDEGSGREVETIATAAADFEPLTQGCWFFEVLVESVTNSASGLPCSDRIGLTASTNAAVGVLGADRDSFALTAAGEVVHAGNNVSVGCGPWAAGDILGCIFDLSAGYSVRFAHNGQWCAPICGSFEGASETFSGLRVAFCISAKTKLSPNFGEHEFRFAPPCPFPGMCRKWQCLLGRPVADMNEIAWGYHFCVKPLRDLHMKVTRAVELICRIKLDDGQRLPGSPKGSKGIWLWRAKSADNFVGCGDIVTTDCGVPRGAIIVDKSQCAYPSCYKRVFILAKNGAGVTLWRPVPPSPEYVSLGDVAVINTSGIPPPKEAVLCVPRWAVKECSIGARVFKSKRGGADASKKSHSVSIWANRNALGTFFGSPFDKRTSEDAAKVEDTEVKGIEVSYMLSYNVSNDISGEWSNDEEVLNASSISWTAELLDYLLENSATRLEVLTPDTFSMLVKYATSSSSPAPLVVIPLMIKMIRMAREMGVELPLSSIDGLCKSILKKAQSKTMSASASGVTLSNSLVRLVDLVVETQSAQVASAAIKDMEAMLAARDAPDPSEGFRYFGPAENIPAPSAADEPNGSALVPTAAFLPRLRDQSRPWWDREGLVVPAALEATAAISLSNIKIIFLKDQLIRKLKQVLIFLAAMGATPSLMTCRLNGSPDALVPVSCRYPKLIIAKVWHDYASVCAFAESEHPYKTAKFEKHISFPGADKLRIMVDNRTTFGPGAQLTLTVGPTKVAVTSSSTTMNFQGNDLTIHFDVTGVEVDGVMGDPSNPANDWGWAIVVHASGPIFESSTVFEELDAVDETAWQVNGDAKSGGGSGPLPLLDTLMASLSAASMAEAASKGSELDGKLPPSIEVEGEEVPHPAAESPRPKPPVSPIRTSLAGGSSAKDSKADGKKVEINAYDDDRIIELVTTQGVCGNRGTITVPHASEVEVKLSRPHPNPDDAKYVRVVVADYKCQSSEDVSEQNFIKVMLPTSNSHIVKFSVKACTIGYCVYSMSRAFLEATFEAEDSTKKVTAGDIIAEQPAAIAETSAAEEQDHFDPSLWRCEQCTYINGMDAHSCEMCGFLHSTLAWSCAGCTYVNAQSNRT